MTSVPLAESASLEYDANVIFLEDVRRRRTLRDTLELTPADTGLKEITRGQEEASTKLSKDLLLGILEELSAVHRMLRQAEQSQSVEPGGTAQPWPHSPSGEVNLEREVSELAGRVYGQAFEDGVRNEISSGVETLLRSQNRRLIEFLAGMYRSRALNPSFWAEVLPWLGRFDHPVTRESRFWLLVSCLRDSDPSVRSAASLGLAALEDSRAIPYLRQAMESEKVDVLRSWLEKSVAELDALPS